MIRRDARRRRSGAWYEATMADDADELYAYFTVTGSFDPAALTARAGIEPTEAWRMGDPHPRGGPARRFSRWSLRSRLADDEPLEAHVRDVVAQLDARPEEMRAIVAEHGGRMQLVAYFYGRFPGLHFDTELVASLARYGLAVDFDGYNLAPERDHEH